MLTIPPFRLIPALLALFAATAAAASTPLQPGEEARCRLTYEEPVKVFRLEVPAGEGAHVVAVSDLDIDLFVHASELAEDDLGSADRIGNSLDGLECLSIPSADVGVGSGARTYFVHVHNPEADSRELDAVVLAWTAKARILSPGKRVRLTIAAGADGVESFVRPVGRLDFVCVRAESTVGRPSLRVSRGETAVVGEPRGGWSSVVLSAGDHELSGLWKVHVGRPEGVGPKEPVNIALEASFVTQLPPADDERRIATDPVCLVGPKGVRNFEIMEDDSQICVLDVAPGTHGFDLLVEAAGTDIDLYVTRNVPVEMNDANWSYASWREGEDDFLHVGGPSPLPAGRYWIRIVNHDGSAETSTFRFRRRTGPRLSTLKPSGLQVRPDAPARILFEENQAIEWAALPAGTGPGSHLQVFFSDKDVDLVVARSDTRRIIARKESIRNDEHLVIDENMVVPPGTRFVAGVFRWSVGGRASAGTLHLGVAARPELPDGYLPPYPGWGESAYERSLAAAVEIVTDDGSGSGVVVSPGGLVLTCHHVIEDGGTILVAFPLGQRGRPRQAFEAKVVYEDADLDLALLELRLDLVGRSTADVARLAFVPIGKPDVLRLGDPLRVVAYGNSGSSRFGSNLLMLAGVLAGIETEGASDRWLITDARLGDGNSGGGYYNERYELVAIHNMGVGDDGDSLAYGRPLSLLPGVWRRRIAKDGGVLTAIEAEKER